MPPIYMYAWVFLSAGSRAVLTSNSINRFRGRCRVGTRSLMGRYWSGWNTGLVPSSFINSLREEVKKNHNFKWRPSKRWRGFDLLYFVRRLGEFFFFLLRKNISSHLKCVKKVFFYVFPKFFNSEADLKGAPPAHQHHPLHSRTRQLFQPAVRCIILSENIYGSENHSGNVHSNVTDTNHYNSLSVQVDVQILK